MSEITPNTPNPVREDAYVEELAEKLGIDPQYIPKSPVWRNEEEIKAIAEMFANMSGGGVLIVHSTYDEDTGIETLDTTAKVILTAMKSGLVMVVNADETYATVLLFVSAFWNEEEGYVFIRAESPDDSESVLRPALCSRFVAAGDNDYPVTDLT